MLRSVYFTRFVKFSTITIRKEQLLSKLDHARDLGILNHLNIPVKELNHLTKDQKNMVLRIYYDEITRIIKSSRHIQEFHRGPIPTYAFIY